MGSPTVVIVPARDEAERIAGTLVALSEIPNLSVLVVVDDGSRDLTAEVSRLCGAEVVVSSPPGRSRGKGHALLVGLARARCLSPEALLLADADLGASASKLAALIPALDDEHPVSIAAFPRARGGGFGLVKSLARRGIARRTGRDFAEPLSGQRALLPPALDALPGIAPGFGAEVGMTLDWLAAGIEPREIPLPLCHRPTGRSPAGFAHRARQGRDALRALSGTRHPW